MEMSDNIQREFLQALHMKDVAKVSSLLELSQGDATLDINAHVGDQTPFTAAITAKNIEITSLILKHGAKSDDALFYCIDVGSEALVRVLCEHYKAISPGYRLLRCMRWAHLPRVHIGASLSTTSSRCDDLWGKMATGQINVLRELYDKVKDTKVHRNSQEKEDVLKRIQQLKNTIRESEQKLTGLQRMKYMEEYDKEKTGFEQMKDMKHKMNTDSVIEPQVIHSVQEIRNDPKFRFAQSFANLIASSGLFLICFFMYKTFNTKVEERKAALEELDNKKSR